MSPDLEAGLLQHVAPDLDVHALLLQREAVIGLLLGDVVVEQGGFQRVRRERVLHRQHDVGEVLELAFERPLALRLHVIGVGIGDIGHGAGIHRRHGLRDHVLDGVLRQLDLDAGLGLELLDGVEQRVVFGLVEALAPPDRDRLLLRQRRRRGVQQARQRRSRAKALYPQFPLDFTSFSLICWLFNQLGESLTHCRGLIQMAVLLVSRPSEYRRTSVSRGAMRPRLCKYHWPSRPLTTLKEGARDPPKERARGMTGCPLYPQSRVQAAQNKCAHEYTGSAEESGIPCSNGFTVYFVLSPATGFVVTVIGVMPSIIANLTPTSAAVRTHHFAVRNECRLSLPQKARATTPRPPHPIPRKLTIMIRPSFGTGRRQ